MKELNNKTKRRRKCEMKAVLLGALAFDKRLEILDLLRNGELCEQEIAQQLEMGPSGISRHLQCLRLPGIVSVRQEGARRFYSLKDPRIIDLLTNIDELLAALWQMEKQAMTTTQEEDVSKLVQQYESSQKGKRNG